MLSLIVLSAAATFMAAPATESYDLPFVAGFERFHRDATSPAAVGGHLLLSELNCTACHAAGRAEAKAQLTPKLGPDLSAAGTRLSVDWMRDYLLLPGKQKPGGTMPDLLHGMPDRERRQAASALAAYLSTLKRPFPVYNSTAGNPIAQEFWRKGDGARGRRLYHQAGCVACHAADATYETAGPPSELDGLLRDLTPEELRERGLGGMSRPVPSVPLGDLPAKYRDETLVHFLLAPERTRPGGRMPNLKLRPDEAADLAAYLLPALNGADPNSLQPESTLVDKGRTLFRQFRCGNCHQTKEHPRQPAKLLDELRWDVETSCIGESAIDRPRYRLDQQQVAAIREAQKQLADQDRDPIAAGRRVHLQMLQRNCYACHRRGQRGGVAVNRRRYFETEGNVDLGDEGRLPPPLDGVGRKLQTSWLAGVLKGTGDVRPHLQIRMPRFVGLDELPAQFNTADDGAKPRSARQVFGDYASLAAAGRSLLDTGCVQCHPLRGEHLPGVVGVDLQQLEKRLQPEWFRDFLRQPSRLKPRTRMPTFFPKGKSTSPQVLRGNVDLQIASMWSYLEQLPKQPLPEKLVAGKAYNFELVPRERPLLLRTFMKRAGPHAIAVGFPAKTHFAFDAERVRFAEAWRGRFLDAHGTWFDRFTPLAAPLGEDRIAFPPGVPLARLRDADQAWPSDGEQPAGHSQLTPVFRGYRIDKRGVPTFLYAFGGYAIEDRMQPKPLGNKRSGLARRLTWKLASQDGTNDGAQVWMRLLAGPGELSRDGASIRQGSLTVVLSERLAGRIKLRRDAKLAECLAPLASDKGTIEVEYRW